MESSVTRRGDRGESVILPKANDFDFMLLNSGAAELFQARSDEEVLASILILISKTSGYYHSAGTSPEGMKSGASPFLISEVASALASSGRDWLNLGGADPDAEGLRRFKKGFGARENALPAGVYSMISPFERTLLTMARAVKNVPSHLVGTMRRRKPLAG
jgi:lipid II:glycine glycyltransferase (peptidoglycan interpeptide bridge formation enzyme)